MTSPVILSCRCRFSLLCVGHLRILPGAPPRDAGLGAGVSQPLHAAFQTPAPSSDRAHGHRQHETNFLAALEQRDIIICVLLPINTMQCAPQLYWLIVTEMRTHWQRTPDARHVCNVRNRQHNTQRRYLLHLTHSIVLSIVLSNPYIVTHPFYACLPEISPRPPSHHFFGPRRMNHSSLPSRGLHIVH